MIREAGSGKRKRPSGYGWKLSTMRLTTEDYRARALATPIVMANTQTAIASSPAAIARFIVAPLTAIIIAHGVSDWKVPVGYWRYDRFVGLPVGH